MFAQRGLHRTTTVQIARGAGVAAGTFYLHFRDKHELFRAIVFDALAELRARLRHTAAQSSESPQAAIRARVAVLLDFAEENRNLVQVIFGRDHQAANIEEDVLDELVPSVEAGLRKRMAAGHADPDWHPAVAARALTIMWARVVAWWSEDPERAPREAVIETLVRLHPVSRSTREPDSL